MTLQLKQICFNCNVKTDWPELASMAMSNLIGQNQHFNQLNSLYNRALLGLVQSLTIKPDLTHYLICSI